jgi:5-methylcytosine-specific restriction endonuclease McrA
MANRARTGRTDGQDKRGNSKDRAARRRYLLDPKAGFQGNGEVVPCALGTVTACTLLVDYVTMEVDRIVPGAEGGRYIRSNIRPTCRPCNEAAGHDTQRAVLAAKKEMATATA